MLEFANVAVAVIVPFVSVWAAQRLVRHDARRQAATEAFTQLHRHGQEHVKAFLTLRRTDEFRYQAEKNDKHLTAGFRERREGEAEVLASTVINLETDCLVLGLIFDHAADSLGREVREFAHRADVLLEANHPRPPHPDDCHRLLQNDINTIGAEMKQLWDAHVIRRRKNKPGWRAAGVGA